MSCTLVAFTSRGKTVPLSTLPIGAHAIVSSVLHAATPRVEQLLSLGITPGALVTMMQRFPGVVFLCDQTELAVERAVADAILVRPMEELR
jgi:Fe2+ transport system protein FeoA